MNEYRYGYESNNVDEWSSGECPGCGETVSHEWNYDSYENVRIFPDKIVKRPTEHKRQECSFDINELASLLENVEFYDIDELKGTKGRKTIGPYVNRILNKLFEKSPRTVRFD